MKTILSIAFINLIFLVYGQKKYSVNELFKLDSIVYIKKDSTRLTGISYEIYDTQKIKSELSFVDGKRNGKGISWHPNGKLYQEQNYIDNKRDGYFKLWNKNGKLNSEEYYVLDLKEGPQKYYFTNGKMKEEDNYTSGIQNGYHRYWNKKSQLISEDFYSMSLKNGRQMKWNKHGKIISEENYENGKRIGWQKYYSSNGKVLGEANLVDGNGSLTIYFDNGKKASEEHFLNGDYNGIQKRWSEIGTLLYEIEYKDNEPVKRVFKSDVNKDFYTEERNKRSEFKLSEIHCNKSDSCWYYIKKNKRFKVTGIVTGQRNKKGFRIEFYYKNGKEHGFQRCYSGNQMTFESYYENGIMQGKNKSWCSDGHLLRESEFKDGKLINEYKKFFCNGNTEFIGSYSNGKKIGIHKEYYLDGKIKSETNYGENGFTHTYKSWFPSGLTERDCLANNEWIVFTYYANNQMQSSKKYRSVLETGVIEGVLIKGPLKSSSEMIESHCWDEKGNEVNCE